MKTINLIFILIFTLSFSQINAQSEKEQEKEGNKVNLFSEDEYANLHVWFNNESKKLNLSEEVENEYSSILSMHWFRMRRLNDKDQGNSKEEIILKVNQIFEKLNEDVKLIITEDQYTQHLEIINEFSEIVLNKLKLEE